MFHSLQCYCWIVFDGVSIILNTTCASTYSSQQRHFWKHISHGRPILSLECNKTVESKEVVATGASVWKSPLTILFSSRDVTYVQRRLGWPQPGTSCTAGYSSNTVCHVCRTPVGGAHLELDTPPNWQPAQLNQTQSHVIREKDAQRHFENVAVRLDCSLRKACKHWVTIIQSNERNHELSCNFFPTRRRFNMM